MEPKRRTRVALVLAHLEAGGVERIMLNLLRHMDRARFEPTLVLVSNHGSLVDQLPADVPVHGLDGRRMLASVPALRDRLWRIRPDVVHGSTNVVNIALIAAALLMRDGPAVIIGEHTPARFYRDEAKWPLVRLTAMRHLYPRAWGVVAPLPDIGRELQEVLNRRLRVHILDNPVVDSVPATPVGPRPPAIETGRVNFVGAGRLVHLKGFDLMIEAMARITGSLADCRLVVIGDGPERVRLETLAADRGLGERIRFMGVVDNPMDYFHHADAVVTASRYEAAPNVLVEAMAAGVPVIAADCPVGPKTILLGGQAGLLVPPEDPVALAAAMMRLAGDPALRDRLVAKGLERAREFSVAAAVPAYERLFEAAAQKEPARAD